ncbi:hypothetical protein OAM67_01665 [bacterium]|nr:hypothetical protein [bacterium]
MGAAGQENELVKLGQRDLVMAGELDDLRKLVAAQQNEIQALRDQDTTARADISTGIQALQERINRTMQEQKILTDMSCEHEVQRRKHDMEDFVNTLVATLTLKVNVLRLKAKSYTNWYDKSQVYIIAISVILTALTTTESLIAAYYFTVASNNEDLRRFLSEQNTTEPVDGSVVLDPATVLAFAAITLLFSTTITFLTAFIRIRGWKQKASDMDVVYNQAMFVITDLPQTLQRLKRVRTIEDLETMRRGFMDREYKLYIETIRAINSHLSYQSQTNHLPAFYDINLKNKRDELNYNAEMIDLANIERLQKDALDEA